MYSRFMQQKQNNIQNQLKRTTTSVKSVQNQSNISYTYMQYIIKIHSNLFKRSRDLGTNHTRSIHDTCNVHSNPLNFHRNFIQVLWNPNETTWRPSQPPGKNIYSKSIQIPFNFFHPRSRYIRDPYNIQPRSIQKPWKTKSTYIETKVKRCS